MTGILKYTGTITDFSVWDDTINSCVKKFYEQYNVYPNIFIGKVHEHGIFLEE